MTRRPAFALALALVTGVTAPAPAAAQLTSATGIPRNIRLTVTGDPANPAFLRAQIRETVISTLSATLVVPAATLHVDEILPAPQALESGFLTSFRVIVHVDGSAGATARVGLTTVDVDNAAVSEFEPVRLALADDPEQITADGVLSRTTIDAQNPTRLYYYHENRRELRRFCVVLSANDSVRTRVQIIGAAAGPDIDVMGVGHAATKAFLGVEPHNEGIIVDIAGGKPLLDRDVLVGPGDGIVGAIDFRVLEGGPLTATAMAIPLAAEPAAYLYAAKLGDDGHQRHGSFDLRGYAQRVIAYTAGGPDATYVYGNRRRTLPNTDPADAGRDYGDYGVLQRVTFDLANPGAVAVPVYLYEKPLGGAVRSSFVVNGAIAELGCARVPQHYLIARYDLGARATGTLEVETMTDGGSNYPLEIGLTTVPPLAQTPPISAAQGCFPKPGGAADVAQPAGRPRGR